MMRSRVVSSLLLLTIFLLSIQSPLLLENSVKSGTSSRSQTIWSGQVILNSDYTISVTDELVIEECTNITMSNDVRIYVEG